MTRTSFYSDFRAVCSTLNDRNCIHFVKETQFNNYSICTFTYNKTKLLCTKFAKWLLKFIKIKRVFIAVEGSIKEKWLLPAMLAVWKMGNAVMPVKVGDSHSKEAKYLISSQKCLEWKLLSTKKFGKRTIYLLKRKEQCYKYRNAWDMSYALSTSGSTGSPVTVKVPWSCIYPNVKELQTLFQLTCNDVVYLGSPPTFDPFFIELFCAITSGASLIVCERHLLPLFSDENGRSHLKITFLQTTPSLFRNLPKEGKFLLSKTSTVRNLVFGGEPFPFLSDKHEENKTNLYNIYGITEVSCWAFVYKVTDLKSIQLGQPLPSITYKVEDGELVLGSALRKCIIGNERVPDLNDVTFRRTGDIVLCEEGFLKYIGRKDSIVKKYGTKINVHEIQKVFLDVDQVVSCCILPVDNAVACALVLHDRCQEIKILEESKFHIIESALKKLKHIEYPDIFVELPHFPLNNHGKTDLKKLQLLLSDCCSKISDTFSSSYLFKVLWKQVLGCKEIYYDRNFMECGGSSILAMQLLSALNAYHVQIPSTLMANLLGQASFEKCQCLFREPDISEKKFSLRDTAKYKPLSILWKFDLKKCVDATPTLVYWQGIEYVVVGSHAGQISLLACRTGAPLWSTYLEDRIESGVCPSSDGSLLFIGCYDHFIYCLQTATGNVLWKYHTEDMVKSTPTLNFDGSRVICCSYDGNLYSLNLQTGLNCCKTDVDGGSLLSRPLVNGEFIFVGTLKGTFACLSSDNLNVIWHKHVAMPIFSSPCFLQNNVLFANVGGSIFCCCSSSGETKWTFVAQGNVFSGLTAFTCDGGAFLTFGCHDSCLYCLTQVGLLSWRTKVNSPISAAPAVSRDQIVCASTKGCIYVLNFRGDILNLLELDGEVFSSPVILGNYIYVGCRDNNLYCCCLDSSEESSS